MPLSPPKPCAKTGCKNMRPCPVHPLTKMQRRSGTPTDPFYQSKAWHVFRAAFLRAHPVCECGQIATLVHHIKPIDEGGEPLDEENCMALCHRCHERKHGRMR